VLLRNVNKDHHHWVELQLVGGPKSPRDATCATVYLKANGMRMRQDVLASGSYISSNDRRLHFGLGDAKDAGTAEIHWPSGAMQTVKLPAEDRIFTITKAKGSRVHCAMGRHAKRRSRPHSLPHRGPQRIRRGNSLPARFGFECRSFPSTRGCAACLHC